MQLVAKETGPGIAAPDLFDAFSKAYSIENCAAYDVDASATVYIGTVYREDCPDRLYALYRYEDYFFYRSLFQAGSLVMGLYEKVFGRKEPPERKKKRGAR